VSLNQIQSSKHKNPTKKFGQKIEKILGVPLAFLKKKLVENFWLNFQRLMVGIVWSEQKIMFTVVGCSFRRFIASKNGI